MGLRTSRRFGALLGLLAAALTTGCPPVNPPDSGLNPSETADRKAIAGLLGKPEVEPYFQSRLINDGVGIFSFSDEAPADDLPRRWGRSYATNLSNSEKAAAEVTKLQFNGSQDAVGTYEHARGGKLVLEYPWQRKMLSKPFVETAIRSARFRKLDGAWRLSDLSLIRIRPEGSKFRAGAFALKLDGQPPLRFKEEDWLPLDELPVVEAWQQGRLEVQLAYEATSDSGFYAFLSVPPMTERLRLRDDGHGGDAVPGDGIYTVEFQFPGQAGVKHLVIEAISSKTFADPAMNHYDATQWGIPYRVRGGEAR